MEVKLQDCSYLQAHTVYYKFPFSNECLTAIMEYLLLIYNFT